VATAGAATPEGSPLLLGGVEGSAGLGRDVFDENKTAAGGETATDVGEDAGGIFDAAENERADNGIEELAGIGELFKAHSGTGKPAVGLIGGVGDIGVEIGKIDAVTGADLKDATAQRREQLAFAGGDERLVIAAGEPHEEGEPHLFEFDGERAVGLVAFVGELGGVFAFVVPEDFAGLSLADGELAGGGVFAFVGAIVEENDDLIGGTDAGLAGDAGEIGGLDDVDAGVGKESSGGEGGVEGPTGEESGEGIEASKFHNDCNYATLKGE
jgi:hypothetical protein